jgi:hypothetical protein
MEEGQTPTPRPRNENTIDFGRDDENTIASTAIVFSSSFSRAIVFSFLVLVSLSSVRLSVFVLSML